MEKRIFITRKGNGELVKISVRNPTNRELELGETEYSKAFIGFLREGIPSRVALEKILRDSGTWQDSDNKEIKEIEDRILSIEKVIEEEKEKTPEAEIAVYEKELNSLRESLGQKRYVRNSYFMHTAEYKASSVQRDFLISQVSEYADSGEKVWGSLDAYRKDEGNEDMLFRASYEYLTFSNGVPSGMKDETDDVVATPVEAETTSESGSDSAKPSEETEKMSRVKHSKDA